MEVIFSNSAIKATVERLNVSFVNAIDVVEVKLHSGCLVSYVRRSRRNDVVGSVDIMESSTSGFQQRIIGDWLVALV